MTQMVTHPYMPGYDGLDLVGAILVELGTVPRFLLYR